MLTSDESLDTSDADASRFDGRQLATYYAGSAVLSTATERPLLWRIGRADERSA
jgi:hypothetical protein